MFITAVVVALFVSVVGSIVLARPDAFFKSREFVNEPSGYTGVLVLIGRRMEGRIIAQLDNAEKLLRATRLHTKVFIPFVWVNVAVLLTVFLVLTNPRIEFTSPFDPSSVSSSVQEDLKQLDPSLSEEQANQKPQKRKKAAKKHRQRQAKPPPEKKTEVSFSSWWVAGPLLFLLSLLDLVLVPVAYRWLTVVWLITSQGPRRVNLFNSWLPGPSGKDHLGIERLAGAAYVQGWLNRRMRSGTVVIKSTVEENPEQKDEPVDPIRSMVFPKDFTDDVERARKMYTASKKSSA